MMLLLSLLQARAFAAETLVPDCPDAKDSGSFTFHGQRLTEIPDIVNPEIRIANAALTAGCFDWVAGFLQRFTAAHPDEYHVLFLRARFWYFNDRPRAQATIEAALRQHPDFTSAKRLLASMAIDDHDFATAARLLREIRQEQPDDLWAYINQLRIDAQVAPSASLFATLHEIINDPRFPQNARGKAAEIARYEMVGPTQAQRDALLADQIKANPAAASCVLVAQAQDIIEVRMDPRAGAALIEQYAKPGSACGGDPMVHLVLAEAYLWQAAKLSRIPAKSNHKLIARATKQVNGDFTDIAQRVAFRPFLNPVLPLLGTAVDVERTDGDGRTLICNAIAAMNPDVVEFSLQLGATANGRCDNMTLVRRVLNTMTRDHVPERQAILRSLLQAGAKVEGLDTCADPDSGDCASVFLPLLREYQYRQGSSSAST
jgi:hypothetical protein